jgi:hypothetical protein
MLNLCSFIHKWVNPRKATYDKDCNYSMGCSTTGKPTRSFATERVSLDSV